MDELENIPVTRHFGIPDNFYTMVTGNTSMDDLEHNPVTTDSGSVRTSGCYAVTGNSSMDDLEYIPVTTDSGTPGNYTMVTGTHQWMIWSIIPSQQTHALSEPLGVML